MVKKLKRNMLTVTAAIMVAATLFGCGANKTVQTQSVVEKTVMTEKEGTVGAINPFVDAETLEEAAKIAGFRFNAPKSLAGYEGTKIQAIESDLIQVIYGDLEHNIYFRKGVIHEGNTDISGDYNEYSDVQTKEEAGKTITVKSENGIVHVITWTEGDYCYSIQSNNGFEYDDVAELIAINQ